MARLGHVGSLKSKWKSSWAYIKMEYTWKWKHNFKNILKLNFQYIYVPIPLWYLGVFLMASLGHIGNFKSKLK